MPHVIRDGQRIAFATLGSGRDTVLLAHNLIGATAAALLTLAHPQRVRGLVLMSATSMAASRVERMRFAALAAVIRALGPGPVMPAILGQLLGARYRAQEPAGAARAAAEIRATTRGDLARSIAAWAGRPALVDRLADIEVPTRIVVGDQDTACPRARGEALAAGLPNASLHVVHGAGHSLQLERPEAVAGMIEQFLATLRA